MKGRWQEEKKKEQEVRVRLFKEQSECHERNQESIERRKSEKKVLEGD